MRLRSGPHSKASVAGVAVLIFCLSACSGRSAGSESEQAGTAGVGAATGGSLSGGGSSTAGALGAATGGDPGGAGAGAIHTGGSSSATAGSSGSAQTAGQPSGGGSVKEGARAAARPPLLDRGRMAGAIPAARPGAQICASADRGQTNASRQARSALPITSATQTSGVGRPCNASRT